MDHVSSWLQAALLPRVWDVCGVRCSSLTVWHSFILGEVGNPYAVPCRAPDRDAATQMLLICSHDHAGAVRVFTDPGYRARATAAIVRQVRRHTWEQIDAAVTEYIDACRRVPAHKSKDPPKGAPPPRMACAPIEWVLVDAIAGGNPEAIEAAWNTPYAVARCIFDARRDIHGEDDSLETRDEERRFDEYAEKKVPAK